jgi:hypothetical protein
MTERGRGTSWLALKSDIPPLPVTTDTLKHFITAEIDRDSSFNSLELSTSLVSFLQPDMMT